MNIMKKTLYSLLISFACSSATMAQPQTPQPPEATLVSIVGSEPTVEINLGAMMLGLLSSATESEEQGIAQILSKLDSIKVTVFELEDTVKMNTLKTKITALAEMKKSQGYEALAKVKEEDSLVYVLAKMDKKNFKSLSVFALDDDDELVLIDIDGTILMSQLGSLMDHFDVDLDINGLKLKNSSKKED
jgi:hypothetical protein